MARQTDKKNGNKTTESREDRLKAALKANMAKRKAQTRARTEARVDKDKEG